MSAEVFLWLVLIIAFALYPFLQYYSTIENSLPLKQNYMVDEGINNSDIFALEHILSKCGTENHIAIAEEFCPLGTGIRNFIEKYSRVAFDEDNVIYSRDLIFNVYQPNPDYLQIANLEYEYILIKANSYDENVYIVNVNEGDLSKPELFMTSLENYVLHEYFIYKQEV